MNENTKSIVIWASSMALFTSMAGYTGYAVGHSTAPQTVSVTLDSGTVACVADELIARAGLNGEVRKGDDDVYVLACDAYVMQDADLHGNSRPPHVAELPVQGHR
ncbi:hypothetical protein [Mycolicibacter arupensis]|uniref:DUF732 domain-containing protein n=1 Tax=Mycolicibacter arupensis TaxID=342002 RepID=A0A5C7Y2N9_9MYCO|nr:hypothetical protein [Mycolicibacter arupensis]TXI55933.1 MAG: hypothetical protein E6Q54_11950 [Mycolicibacter arupensis]